MFYFYKKKGRLVRHVLVEAQKKKKKKKKKLGLD